MVCKEGKPVSELLFVVMTFEFSVSANVAGDEENVNEDNEDEADDNGDIDIDVDGVDDVDSGDDESEVGDDDADADGIKVSVVIATRFPRNSPVSVLSNGGAYGVGPSKHVRQHALSA